MSSDVSATPPATAVPFPSVQWFDAVRAVFNSDDSYRGAGGGHCNCVAGMKIGDDIFVLTFEGLECTGAQQGDAAALDDVDFYLDMAAQDWRDMVINIRDNGHADLHHTLNTLDLNREDGIATSHHGDQYREDLFFRYNQTMQFFFDASARVRSEFAPSASGASSSRTARSGAARG